MRLVIARCSVEYKGRLGTYLPSAVRLLMIKDDGSFLIHSGSQTKPLNWMSAPCTIHEEAGGWRVTNKSGEQLVVTFDEVLHDFQQDLGIDPGLQKSAVEAELQVLLAERCHLLEPGLSLVRREYPTDIGPVDLLCKDETGATVVVEVKRKGEIAGVEQLTRYLQRLGRDPLLQPVRGILAAQDFSPQARVLAADRGIGCVTLDYDALLGAEPATPTLF